MASPAVALVDDTATSVPMSRLARQIVDAICQDPNMSREEQTRQLAVLERALGLVAGAERQIAALKDHIGHLESLSRTDFLTGVANRRGIEEHIRRVLAAAERHGDTGVLVLLDLDRFKAVNDEHGHAAGDVVLRRVAEVLTQNTRVSDFVARIGGDEFAILLAHTGPREGMYRARRLQTILNETKAEFGMHLFPLEASVGAANYGPGTDPVELMRRADLAMYRQKRGKGLRASVRLAS